MNMVIPDEGKLFLSQIAFRDVAGVDFNYLVQLFTNDYTPVDGSTFSSFTLATFTGSDFIQFSRLDFNAPTLVSHVAYVVLPTPPSWTCTGAGPQTCYGWVMWEDGGETVIAAQRFDSPRTMDVGATETLDPFKIALKTFA